MRRAMLTAFVALLLGGCATSTLLNVSYDRVSSVIKGPSAAHSGDSNARWHRPDLVPWRTVSIDEDLSGGSCLVTLRTDPFRTGAEARPVTVEAEVTAAEQKNGWTRVAVSVEYLGAWLWFFDWRDRRLEEKLLKGICEDASRPAPAASPKHKR